MFNGCSRRDKFCCIRLHSFSIEQPLKARLSLNPQRPRRGRHLVHHKHQLERKPHFVLVLIRIELIVLALPAPRKLPPVFNRGFQNPYLVVDGPAQLLVEVLVMSRYNSIVPCQTLGYEKDLARMCSCDAFLTAHGTTKSVLCRRRGAMMHRVPGLIWHKTKRVRNPVEVLA